MDCVMMTRSKLFLSAMIACSFLAIPAFAQDKAKEEPKKKNEKVESVVRKPAESSAKPGEPTGPVKEWIEAENKLIDPLSAKDKESFFILRNKYSIIRVINIVERDIERAVQSCGDKNPNMKQKMDDRFKQWTSAVNPIIETARKQLDKDIDSQKMVDPKKARQVLKLNDEAYEYGEKQIVKTPVTTPEACEDLLASMDRTEDEMILLLRQTLLPEDVIRKRSSTAQKTEKPAAEPAAKKSE
jgi:hypothetical protein